MVAYSFAQLNALYATANGIPDSAHTRIMAAVALAESSGNPSARNGSHLGLWQVGTVHTRDAGWNLGTNFYDPASNARMAEFVYRRQGYGAWTTYTSGAYTKFLGSSTVTTKPPSGASGSPAIFGLPNPLNLIPSIPNPLDAVTNLLDPIKILFDAGFWKRVGIGMIGLLIIFIGLVILLRKPIETGATVAAEAA